MKLDPKDFYFLNHCLPHKITATFLGSPQARSEIDRSFHDTSGNSGNTYIMHCICKILFDRYLDRTEINGVANLFNSNLNDIDTDAINKEYKYVLINMQDQLRSGISYIDSFWHKDTDAAFIHINNFLKKINIPILCYGLGSNSFKPKDYSNIIDELHESQKTFVKIISEKSKVFSVRGGYTAMVMDGLGVKNYAVVGCPTWFMGLKNIAPPIFPHFLEKIVLTGWVEPLLQRVAAPHWKKASPLATKFFFLCQDEIQTVRDNLAPTLNSISMEVIYMTEIEKINNFFEDKGLVVGTRVHGAIMALNNGTPAICLNGDSRAREMCALFKIPNLHPNAIRGDGLIEFISNYPTDTINENYISLKSKHDKFIKESLEV